MSVVNPSWVLLLDPVPPIVTARAVELLAILSLGDERVEVVAVDCTTRQKGAKTQTLKYACETHGPTPHKGITVYGLV